MHTIHKLEGKKNSFVDLNTKCNDLDQNTLNIFESLKPVSSFKVKPVSELTRQRGVYKFKMAL